MKKITGILPVLLSITVLGIFLFAALVLIRGQLGDTNTVTVQPNTVNPNSQMTNNETIENTVEPSGIKTAYPYPAPTGEETLPIVITPTVTETVGLSETIKPVMTYTIPEKYNDMMMLYTKTDPPGFYINTTDGNKEKAIPAWYYSEIEKSENLGIIEFKISPNGSKLLYSFWNSMSFSDPKANSIWITNPNGSQPKLLVSASKERAPINPIWSPDGTEIAYIKLEFNKPQTGIQIWVMNNEGKNERKVYEEENFPFDSLGGKLPIFLWANNGYIFIAPKASGGGFYALDPYSEKLIKLINFIDPYAIAPFFSPDGEHVIITPDLSDKAIRDAGLIPVSLEGGEILQWDSVHKKVYYVPYDNRKEKKIIVRDLISGREEEIKDYKGEVVGVSPDGGYIALQTEEELYLFDLGKEAEELIAKSVKKDQDSKGVTFIAWIPVP